MNIYVDIETIPTQNKSHQNFVVNNLKPPANYKSEEAVGKWLSENRQSAIEKTALDGTFGEIVVIGVAIDELPPKTFYCKDWQRQDREAVILRQFFTHLKQQCVNRQTVPKFIGHNITQFDDRFIFQRAVINKVRPHYTATRQNTYDTMIEWTGYKNTVSLAKLCQVLGIEAKGDIDGSKVWEYVQAGKIDEVAKYCAKDVERVRQIYKRMNFVD